MVQAHRLTATPLDVDALVAELELDATFPPDVLGAADDVAQRPLPDVTDARDIPLVTIDPPGSLDLDQAVAIENRRSGGWVVHYAIADVGRFIDPGGPLDAETRRRGETLYAPGRRIPLHPDVLGQGAASLLADEDRAAILWRIEVDSDGAAGAVDVRRAIVRSRARLDYPRVQTAADTGTLPESIAALPAFGKTRHEWSLGQGAIELNLPEQQIDTAGATWTLSYRSPLPVEVWNAQVSLLTGAAAARIMVEGGIGMLRTLPPAPESTVTRLRRAAPGLDVEWPESALPGQVIAALKLSDPRHVAFADLASSLLRGAAYVSFDGTVPQQPVHAGVGGTYAHATAPIRRLGDRFVNEVCVALAGGAAVPDWTHGALGELPELLAASSQRAHRFDRAIVDGTEAVLLADRVGDTFEAIVVDVEPPHQKAGAGSPKEAGRTAMPAQSQRGTVMLDAPAVSARVDGEVLPLGERTTVRLLVADPSTRAVRFTYPG